jgi:hypothetical protein
MCKATCAPWRSRTRCPTGLPPFQERWQRRLLYCIDHLTTVNRPKPWTVRKPGQITQNHVNGKWWEYSNSSQNVHASLWSPADDGSSNNFLPSKTLIISFTSKTLKETTMFSERTKKYKNWKRFARMNYFSVKNTNLKNINYFCEINPLFLSIDFL